jgi:2,4-dienoyl-CoA reductase-like NADH-dependent reductase (Old Yellow Enzyme family)/thioredoxin reductase
MGYESAFHPIRIGNIELKNRIMMAPMETGLAEKGGFAGERLVRYFAERVKNDVAISITGSIACSPEGRGLPCQLGCYDDAFLPGLSLLTEAVHSGGSRIGGQIYHAGRQATRGITGLQPLAPSPLPCPVMNDIPKEMTVTDMEEMSGKFAQGAARLARAGFDLIEVHMAHGYLLFGFLSPFSNRRTDRYGGSLENRMRFPLDVLRRIQEEVGDRVAVTVRLSVDEFIEGGFTFEDAKEVCKALAACGVHAISVSAGSYASVSAIIQPMTYPRGFLVSYAEQIRRLVAVPVIVAGRINTPQLIEEIIRGGKADMVAIGRALICDPEFVTKMKQGREGEIRPCVACNQGCIDEVIMGGSIRCLGNAAAGRELEGFPMKAPQAKRVLVVGGGPAGMESARVCAIRGHDVLLIEKEAQLGGRLRMAARAPHKEEFANVAAYLESAILRAGVRVRRNEGRVKETCDEFRPDAVVFAAGAEPIVPSIPGFEHEGVLKAEEVLSGKRETGQSVIVVGGGLVGLETSLFLSERGRTVTVVEMTDQAGVDVGPIMKGILSEEIRKRGVTVLTNSRATKATSAGVTIRRGEEDIFVAADTVVLAAGYRSVSAPSILRNREGVCIVGDAREPGNAMNAINEGYRTGLVV